MPISTNPVSIEAGEYGLTRGTWFFARCLDVVAVAVLLWISWGLLVGRICLFFLFKRLRPAANLTPLCLTCLSTSIFSRSSAHLSFLWSSSSQQKYSCGVIVSGDVCSLLVHY